MSAGSRSIGRAAALLAGSLLLFPTVADARCARGSVAVPVRSAAVCTPRASANALEPARRAARATPHRRGVKRNAAAVRLLRRATAFAAPRLAEGAPIFDLPSGGVRSGAARRAALPAGSIGAPTAFGPLTSLQQGPAGNFTARFDASGQRLQMTAEDQRLTIDVRDRTGAGAWATFSYSPRPPRCPQASGEVPARIIERLTYGEATSSHGRRAWISATTTLDGDWTGQVGRSGRAERFDVRLRGTLELRGGSEIATTGKVLRRDATHTYRLALDRAGIPVGTAGASLLGGARLRGPKGARMRRADQPFAGALVRRAADQLDAITDALRDGDVRWFEQRQCARIVLQSSAPERVTAGGTAHWSLVIVDAQGRPAAAAQWALASTCGAVAPETATTPTVAVSVVDSGGRWTPSPPQPACVAAEATSTAGRAAPYAGSIPPQPAEDLQLRVTVHHSEDMGAGIARTKVQAEGRVVLPSDAERADGTGFWDGEEWDGTIGNPCGHDMTRSRGITGTGSVGVVRLDDGQLAVTFVADTRPLQFSWMAVVPTGGGRSFTTARRPFCGDPTLALTASDVLVEVTPVPSSR